MKKIGMYHAQVPNMGDLLNVLLMEEYFKISMVRKTPLTAKLSGIGSGLGQFTLSQDNYLLSSVEKLVGIFPKVVHIWGTGFIENKQWGRFYRKNMVFDAVRGELSKQKIELLLGKSVDTVLGDGGILAPELVEKNIEKEKKYRLGIIPHYKEQQHPVFEKFQNKFSDSKIIDVRDEPHKVLREIAQSELIISSSLHGLIVADAFHVPNYHIVVTDNLLGDGFKFNDYYSSFGLKHKYTSVEDTRITQINENFIKDEYAVSIEKVEKMKEHMKEAFPFQEEFK